MKASHSLFHSFYFIFALATADIFLKIATRGQECATVRCQNPQGLGIPFNVSQKNYCSYYTD